MMSVLIVGFIVLIALIIIIATICITVAIVVGKNKTKSVTSGKYCPGCGYYLNNDVKVCDKCGKEV